MKNCQEFRLVLVSTTILSISYFVKVKIRSVERFCAAILLIKRDSDESSIRNDADLHGAGWIRDQQKGSIQKLQGTKSFASFTSTNTLVFPKSFRYQKVFLPKNFRSLEIFDKFFVQKLKKMKKFYHRKKFWFNPKTKFIKNLKLKAKNFKNFSVIPMHLMI